MQNWPFRVIKSKNDRPKFLVQYKGEPREFFPEEITAMILTKMKDIVQTQISDEITNAVIAVPGYFNMFQREALHDAGLNNIRLINEPSAAAIAFGLKEKSDSKPLALIFDLGGDTFDVSLLNIESGIVEILATVGDTHLCGEDFDNRLVNYFADRFQKKFHCDLCHSPRAAHTLTTQCERAKRTLSTATTA